MHFQLTLCHPTTEFFFNATTFYFFLFLENITQPINQLGSLVTGVYDNIFFYLESSVVFWLAF